MGGFVSMSIYLAKTCRAEVLLDGHLHRCALGKQRRSCNGVRKSVRHRWSHGVIIVFLQLFEKQIKQREGRTLLGL